MFTPYKQNGAVTHSGIVTAVYAGPPAPDYDFSSLIMIQSKWGAAGLYSHNGPYCPYWYDAGGSAYNTVTFYK